MKAHVLITIATISACLFSPALGLEGSRWSVRCGGQQSNAEAMKMVASLGANGYSPVWQADDETGTAQVYVGSATTRAEAYFTWRSLRNAGMGEVEVVSLAKPGTGIESNSTPGGPLLGPASILSESSVTATHFDAEEKLAPIRSSFENGRNEEAVILCESLLPQLADSDTRKGWVAVQYVHGKVAADHKAKPVLPLILMVARGEIAASGEDRLQARWIAADCYHYYMMDRLSAYMAYRQILREDGGNSPPVQARAMVEIAACTLELARSEKATFDEARAACREVIDTTPKEFVRARAVADLMYAESYYWEGRKEEMVTHLRGFENRFPTRLREISMANFFQGRALCELDRWPEGSQYLGRNIGLDLSDPAEWFYWEGKPWNMKMSSAKLLKYFAIINGDKEGESFWSEYMANEMYLPSQPGDERHWDSAIPHKFYELSEHVEAAESGP